MAESDKEKARDTLKEIGGITVFPSAANFFYVKLPQDINGAELRNRLISKHNLFIRECGNKIGPSSQFLRISVKPLEDMKRLKEALLKELYILH
ncbi:MAG: aminotransferase class I/II-fold pyridoxal phosphate-dependent enzyme [Bacteriovoracaceae bacterium]|nr:aminotransferase class I/II-fold pyridoxal phosphate-dependent enzyme [Bacteriovoracaceae bacterium]